MSDRRYSTIQPIVTVMAEPEYGVLAKVKIMHELRGYDNEWIEDARKYKIKEKNGKLVAGVPYDCRMDIANGATQTMTKEGLCGNGPLKYTPGVTGSAVPRFLSVCRIAYMACSTCTNCKPTYENGDRTCKKQSSLNWEVDNNKLVCKYYNRDAKYEVSGDAKAEDALIVDALSMLGL